MFDIHSHILPGIDDGAVDAATALDMARAYQDQGVRTVACTPHILPGLYHNSGPQIRAAVEDLQTRIRDAGIDLELTTGADNHVVPDFVALLERGHLLSVGDSRYVLVEPPHHVAPARLDGVFFDIMVAGYTPILTHPERLTWIEQKYDLIKALAARGVWMQLTCGSVRGRFGRRAKYWAERMLDEGLVHLLATDAHDLQRRPPDLDRGKAAAARRLGDVEAEHLVETRPRGVLANVSPEALPPACGVGTFSGASASYVEQARNSGRLSRNGFAQRLRSFFHH